MKVYGIKEEAYGNTMVTDENESFKHEFDIHKADSMETLNREDIERQIIDLYFNQMKTYRENTDNSKKIFKRYQGYSEQSRSRTLFSFNVISSLAEALPKSGYLLIL